MENVFHRDPAERAILRTEITEGMAVGPGSTTCADAAACAATAKLLLQWGWFVLYRILSPWCRSAKRERGLAISSKRNMRTEE